MATQRRTGTWSPDDRASDPYPELAFDVPADTPALTVRLDYDRDAGVLDLGCLGPSGFRGWSGGSRDTFTVATDWATPGYLPGEVEAGTWRVCVGLHRVPANGIAYEVTVDTTPVPMPPPALIPPTPARAPRRELPAEPGRRWLAGDLHSHTVHSDGSLTVDELACLAAESGLDFLAVTDHNTVSHHPELAAAGSRAGVILLPGQEVTTDLGHANAFGDIGWIDFRRPVTNWLDETDRRGGLLSINHPLAADNAWRHPMARRPRFAEVWHWTWLDRTWGGPLAWWLAWGPDVIPLGGSDFHSPAQGRPLGKPTTWVQCDGDNVLAGIAEGRVAISAGRDAPVLLRVGDELIAIDADGTYVADQEGRRRLILGDRARFTAPPGPHHLETANNSVIAIAT
ncbi:MAG: CehA/McbA family metallohydrolase [Actinomycetota bacterium]|nr:CehA/McbA family metallohydrolase [Actinomycetota bacterium]